MTGLLSQYADLDGRVEAPVDREDGCVLVVPAQELSRTRK
jgi:hypothetical protein